MTCEGSIAVPGTANTSGGICIGSFDEGMNNMTTMYNQFILKDVSFASSPNSSYLSTSPANPLISAMLTRPTGSEHFQPQPTTVTITTCTTLHNPDFTTFNEGSMFSSVSDGFLEHDDDMLDHDVVAYVPSDSSRSPTSSPDHYSTCGEVDTSSRCGTPTAATSAPALSGAVIPDKLWFSMSVRERQDICQALSHHLITALTVRERTEALAIVRGSSFHSYHSSLIGYEELNNDKYEQLRRFFRVRAQSTKSSNKLAKTATRRPTAPGKKNSWQSLLKRSDSPSAAQGCGASTNKKSLLKKSITLPSSKDSWNLNEQRSLVKKHQQQSSKPSSPSGDCTTYQSEDAFIKKKIQKIQKQKMRERKSGLFGHEEVVCVSSVTSSMEATGEDELDICG